MGKRRSKKQKKTKFPHQITFIGCEFPVDDFIVADAGFDTIDYELALSCFDIETIINWWECYFDIEDLTDDQFTEWEQIFTGNYSKYYDKPSDFQEIINNAINQFNFLPKELGVATARAVFNPDYQWVKIITLIDKYDLIDNIDYYELEAIKLALKMRAELDDENIVIINDNKHAVADITGNRFYDFYDDNNFENNLKVVWASRKNVKLADQLTIKEATKIFTPDDDLDNNFE